MNERKYFLVGEGSPAMAAIQKAMDTQRAFWKVIEGLKTEFGASAAYTFGYVTLAGLVFDGEIPKGWRQKPAKPYCVPDRKSAEGRKIHERLSKTPGGVDGLEFCSWLGRAAYTHWSDNHVYFTSWQNHGDKYILSVPAQCAVEPEGCTRLKMSEYWRIVEEAQENAS